MIARITAKFFGKAPNCGLEFGLPDFDQSTVISELHKGLDNYVTQLHRSVASAKKTHFYKALVAAGGKWSGVGRYS